MPGKSQWWLSFADEHRPRGQQFLGAAIVSAGDLREAMQHCWDMGINPGGQIAGIEVAAGTFAPEWCDRLLTKEEAMSVPGR